MLLPVCLLVCLRHWPRETGSRRSHRRPPIQQLTANAFNLHSLEYLAVVRTRHTKGLIDESVDRTIVLHGFEAWPLRLENQRRLEGFDNDCLRRILCHRHLDHVPYTIHHRQIHLRALPPVLFHRRLR